MNADRRPPPTRTQLQNSPTQIPTTPAPPPRRIYAWGVIRQGGPCQAFRTTTFPLAYFRATYFRGTWMLGARGGKIGVVQRCLLFLLGTGLVLARSHNGSLKGSVVDMAGSSVRTAVVTVKSSHGRPFTHSTRADRDGCFTFKKLKPNSYELCVRATGFKSKVHHI
jgi:hypothetical protein